jgi:hypothetical protein
VSDAFYKSLIINEDIEKMSFLHEKKLPMVLTRGRKGFIGVVFSSLGSVLDSLLVPRRVSQPHRC